MWKYVCLIASLVAPALANVDKTIFLGPKAVIIPPTHPNLEDLRVHTLTPSNGTIRTHVEAQFPSDTAKFGKATWLVLDGLTEGQRYEVKICWVGTQPTAFHLSTYELETVFGTPELVTELSEYSWSQQRAGDDGSEDPEAASSGSKMEREASVLLLRILAAADYFTTNTTLMNNVPPVFVDITLDPFILNVLPRTLAPTVGYIVIVTVISWFLGLRISRWIRELATTPDQTKKDQ